MRDATGDRQTGLRTIAERHATALADLSRATALPEVLGIKGHAARDYFRGLALLALGAMAGRTRRPPLDPVNCLLSFGYGMLRVAVHGALEQVGLGSLSRISARHPLGQTSARAGPHGRVPSAARRRVSSSPWSTENSSTGRTPKPCPEEPSSSPMTAVASSWSNGQQPGNVNDTTPDSAETSLLRGSHLSKRDCWRAISAATAMPTYPGRRANGPTCSDFA